MQKFVNLIKSCRSRQELSNKYIFVKIDVDTAENEPLKVWRKIQCILHSAPYSSGDRRGLRDRRLDGAEASGSRDALGRRVV